MLPKRQEDGTARIRTQSFLYKICLINLVNIGRSRMKEIIEMGTISSRGQIAIPADIRREMKLKEGEKVLFLLEEDTLLIKRVMPQSFAEITRPLKEAAKKAGMREEDVPEIITRFRKKKR